MCEECRKIITVLVREYMPVMFEDLGDILEGVVAKEIREAE